MRISKSAITHMEAVIPPEMMAERLSQFKKLVNNHFSVWEAVTFVTATTPATKTQPERLQNLDLNNETWQKFITYRKQDYNEVVADLMKRGLPHDKAGRVAMMRVWEYFNVSNPTASPFEGLKILTPPKKDHVEADYNEGVENRGKILIMQKQKAK